MLGHKIREGLGRYIIGKMLRIKGKVAVSCWAGLVFTNRFSKGVTFF